MHKLLWIGSPFFAKSLPKCGWDLRFHNFEQTTTFSWRELCQLADGPPDVLVVSDKSRPPFVLGMESFPCLTVFYAVDTHIHSYYPYYAQGFDLCLVSLKDHINLFQGQQLSESRIIHSPPFAKDEDLPPAKSEEETSLLNSLFAEPEELWDLLFVGTVDPVITPQRQAFLSALQQKIPGLQITRGKYRELYPKAKIVLNYCELGDLNFRVFEALGCGACLLTPEVGHGFTEMFTPEQDLFTYNATSVEDVAARAAHLLEHPILRAEVAAAGLAKVNRAHRAIHRAENLTSCLLNLLPASKKTAPGSYGTPYGASAPLFREVIDARLREAPQIHEKYLRFLYLLLAEKVENTSLKNAYLKAATYAPLSSFF